MKPLLSLRKLVNSAGTGHQSQKFSRAMFWMGSQPNEPWWWSWARAILFSAGMVVLFDYASRVATIPEPRTVLAHATPNMTDGPLMTICISVGLIMQLLYSVSMPLLGGRERMARRSRRWQSSYFIGVGALGVMLGWPIGLTLASGELPVWFDGDHVVANVVALAMAGYLFGAMLDFAYGARMRQAQAEKRATESKLRLLQGQIEPHFMFNTLANVHSLIGHDAAKALRMLESFTDYLRSSTIQLRGDDGTLGEELELVSAYLQLQQIRMDDRLHYVIEVDPELQSLPLPPLLVQPLVENAIRHGIEPKVDGGEVRVRMVRQGNYLCIEIRETGLGLEAAARSLHRTAGPTQGAGVALANLRERLQARYGNDATLTLTDVAPGTLATLKLPYPAVKP
jgi:hypothetical protein